MNTPNRLLVGLDLSPADDTLMEYTAFLCTELEISYVCFIHVEKSLEIPFELLQDVQRDNLTAEERFRQMISEKVNGAFQNIPQVETEVVVDEGTPLKQLLHWTKVKEIDLIIVCRKLRLHGSGVLAQKLLRTGRNSVLFVPEAYEPRLRRIVVSMDFSKYSDTALDRVLHSALSKPGVQVVCLHVYQVPTGYITLGISYEEFDERMRGFARDKYDSLTARFPELKERGEFVLVRQGEQDNIGELVVMEAKRVHADMLVIGAKGMSAAALFVLGSVTEKVLRKDMDIPLLVVKNKDEKVGFIDALIG
ncbi:universal stress protein [Pontibacter sp. CAU 1760]